MLLTAYLLVGLLFASFWGRTFAVGMMNEGPDLPDSTIYVHAFLVMVFWPLGLIGFAAMWIFQGIWFVIEPLMRWIVL